jgi:hypothetical protein
VTEPRWHKSSHSTEGNCVEVATAPDATLMRDSKLQHSPVLRFDPDAWSAFIDAVRAGEFAC